MLLNTLCCKGLLLFPQTFLTPNISFAETGNPGLCVLKVPAINRTALSVLYPQHAVRLTVWVLRRDKDFLDSCVQRSTAPESNVNFGFIFHFCNKILDKSRPCALQIHLLGCFFFLSKLGRPAVSPSEIFMILV